MDPATQDPLSRAGKLFRLRFRLPWDLFSNFLLPWVEEAGWWPPRSSRRARVPLEIKVLISLRRLGRGLVADYVAELSHPPPHSTRRTLCAQSIKLGIAWVTDASDPPW